MKLKYQHEINLLIAAYDYYIIEEFGEESVEAEKDFGNLGLYYTEYDFNGKECELQVTLNVTNNNHPYKGTYEVYVDGELVSTEDVYYYGIIMDLLEGGNDTFLHYGIEKAEKHFGIE